MSQHAIRLPEDTKHIRSGHIPQGGKNPAGDHLGVNGYHLEWNGRPFFAVSGELHYSRCHESAWEDELVKLKMAGVNIVSTYVFWNHHEELQGQFDWTGRRNLRRFVELCGERGILMILRIGPWCHGEVRNGGFPDWLYGRPFELRSNDEGYLACVRALYREIATQVRGLLFKDGGPIVGTQLENEYMHSAAPWEMTTGTSNEWVPSGRDGEAHILTLKRLAREAGIDTPLYTCTAWGGAAVPVPEVLPLWGGYAFQPWIFYGSATEHPATPEYIFRDYHDDATPRTYNFEPRYRPEDYPYACCEMGGGMQVYYRYRFRLPPESVEAMAIIKAAGGCNFLGYYMFHGGTNPAGKRVPFLNEHATPKLSYDYQAPIGEFGQLRGQYGALKALHLFLTEFQDTFCPTRTVLPGDTSAMDPRDVDTLRWAVRARGSSGFLFLVNYQDHAETKDHHGLAFELSSPAGTLRLPHSGGLRLARNVSCVLPFQLDLGGLTLRYAVGQPLTRLETKEGPTWFFFTPEGMRGEYCFAASQITDLAVTGGTVRHAHDGAEPVVIVEAGPEGAVLKLKGADLSLRTLVVLTREHALQVWKAKLRGVEHVLVSEAAVLADGSPTGGALRFECAGTDHLSVKAYPALPEDLSVQGAAVSRRDDGGPFACYDVALPPAAIPFAVERVGERKVVLRFERASFRGFKRVILQIDYTGDVGNAYLDGRLVADNFCNGTPWEVELTCLGDPLFADGMYLDVVPLRKDARVIHDTSMGGRQERTGEEIGKIGAIRLLGVREVTFR